jgi:hypothetical protein
MSSTKQQQPKQTAKRAPSVVIDRKSDPAITVARPTMARRLAAGENVRIVNPPKGL